MQELFQLITTVGFPIAACVYLGLFIEKSYKSLAERADNRENKLYETITNQEKILIDICKTNTNFVKTLEVLSDKLSETQEDVEEIKNKLNIVDNNKKG